MKIILLLAASLLFSLLASAQSYNGYKQEWQEIDSLIMLKDLPKTALAKVEVIYADAKQKGIPDEMLKALVYRLSLAEKNRETDINRKVSSLIRESQGTPDIPVKAVLTVMLANELQQYYQQNMWRDSRRTDMKEYRDTDIATWTHEQLVEVIDSCYDEALRYTGLLQQTRITYLNAIIIKGNTGEVRPTLYDLIAHEALGYYQIRFPYLTESLFSYTLADTAVLARTNQFLQQSFTSPDTLSHVLKAVRLFQQVLHFHNKDADPAAFIDVDIERLAWAHGQATISNKDSLYKEALQYIADKFSHTKPGAEAWYLLAGIETEKASGYTPFGDTTDRYAYVKAKALIERRLQAMPAACYGNAEMKVLLHRITSPELSTKAESVTLPGEPFRVLAEYKNVDTLYARILWQHDVKKAEAKKGWNQWREISALPFIKTYSQILPKTNDYQKHSVEIKMDGLPSGDYVILFSNHPSFSNRSNRLATQAVSVSRLAYMHTNEDYFVVDRESGQPIKGVKTMGTIEVRKNNGDRWITKKIAPPVTDNNGHVRLPVDTKKYSYSRVNISFQKDRDTLQANDDLYRYSYNNDDDEDDDTTYEEDNSHVYFFTDRSIYRPGQTVWFKGIVTTKDRSTKRNQLYHYTDSIEVDLHDANSNQIDSQFVRLNEYGSFSGKFVLPQQVLTGTFFINTTDMEKGRESFSVEEYKRPLFYVVLDTLKDSYRLNDTIVVTGSAKAFAGNAVDGAKVTYHVDRWASFPHPYLFRNTRQPYSDRTEIADSTVSTDADGNFTIRFVAVPDSSINKNTEPLFNFNIELSVTDANGETHEAKMRVPVTYQAVQLQVKVPEINEAARFKNIFITTQNSAGENIPASVKLSISPLQTPAKAYRKRLWERPDQYVMSREEFERTFPYDEYGEETDYQSWKEEAVMIRDTFSTANTSTYSLPKQLPQGWYRIEATTRDKDSSEVKDVKYIQLYDMNAEGLPSPQTNFSQIVNNAGVPGQNAKLLLGSSERNVFVVLQTKKQDEHSNGVFSYAEVDNGKKEITYTIRPDDPDNVGLYYGFVKHSRFYNGGMQVYVSHDEKQLNIAYATYRNRTEPGNKETWTVKVSDSSGKASGAELLTSMYDGSLDQFTKHSWDIPLSQTYAYISNDWGGDDFDDSYSDENSDYNRFYSLPKIYDHIAGSARDFLDLYIWERNKRITIAQFTPPRIVKDEEVMEATDSVVVYDLEGKVSGLEIRGNSASGFFNEGEIFLNSTRVRNEAGQLNDVVVIGYGTAKRKDITGSVAVVTTQNISDTSYFRTKIRGIAGVQNVDVLLVVIDSVVTDKKISELDMSAVDHVDVFKGSEATDLFGDKAANGAILIITKDFALRNGKKKEEPQVQVRRNFNETAFFYPQLHADSSGNYSFSFTMPDAVTTWKWMSLAHTKNLQFGYRTQSILSQKTVMVQPNLPRFLREGDSVVLTAKISNLSDSTISGKAVLEITDAVTNQSLNNSFHVVPTASFSTSAGASTVVHFSLRIPASFTHPLTIKIIATAGRFSDGEEKVLPVLSRRKLITETLPLFMSGNGEKHMVWEKLKATSSSTLTNESLTVEYTPNPVWQVVQSLPYLMEYPHQCAEQTFNRFYANALASYLLAKHPQIRQTFNAWLADTTALQSQLDINPELKNILLNETPWVTDAEDERTQKKNLAMLFNETKLSLEKASAIEQLKEMQLSSGAFPWFGGGGEDRYITQYILTGIGKLERANAVWEKERSTLDEITGKALRYLDKETKKEYTGWIKNKVTATAVYLSESDIQYWYMRSFFSKKKEEIATSAFSFFVQQADAQRSKLTPYMQGMIAIALNRLLPLVKGIANSSTLPVDIIRSLKENAVTDSVKGMYWKTNEDGYYWYQSAIESQTLLISAFAEIATRDSSVAAMQQWLIMNRQTQHWSTTKATADADYALLFNQSQDSSQSADVTIRLGDSLISTKQGKKEAGTDYIKHRIDGKKITSRMGEITITVSQNGAVRNPSSSPSYGAIYRQYFEDMDKVTASSSSPLSVSRALFIESNTAKGKQLQPVTEKKKLVIGDKLAVRLIIKSDRDMDYIQLADTRGAMMEPLSVLSGYQWQDGLGYYQSTKDAATHFFIDHLPKGTYVLEYPVYITHSGYYSAGMATVQCMYAPQFAAHSESTSVEVISESK